MPFVISGKAPDFTLKGFCCLQVNGKWKLHFFDGKTWQRVKTGLPEDAIECSPTAEISNRKWQVSFIAGGYEANRKLYLYQIADLENPSLKKIVRADVGFIWKNKIVFGNRSGELKIIDGDIITTLTFPHAEYIYRVSYNPNKPQELLISGQYSRNIFFSWICDANAKRLQSVSVNGKPAFKAAFWEDTLYYAKREKDAGFKERHIVKSNTYDVSELDFEANVKIKIEKQKQTTSELLAHFAQSMKNWAISGFKIADAQTVSNRKSICSTCENWDKSAFAGFGKCKKCGCSSAKLKLESEHCPIKKW